MPRLIRRQPLSDRIKAYLDPYDFLLWLSEELHDSSWDEALKDWTAPIGAVANISFIIARANSGSSSTGSDDVFGDFDGRHSSGWFAWLCSFTSHLLALTCMLNAVYTFFRKRHYRLFESSIDEVPSTPSARRVNVNDSPASSSPLRYLSTKAASAMARSRTYPDQTRDVWEISVWDPKDINLELFCLFSPGHVVIYWLFLPVASSDPRPSVTVVLSILLGALVSAQLVALRICFQQQSRDLKIINKEVLNEYDTKFVHPNINKPVRDVATQTTQTSMGTGMQTREVDLYTPTTIINKGFQVNPNPSYTQHLSDDSTVEIDSPSTRISRKPTSTGLFSPLPRSSTISSFGPTSVDAQSRADSTTPSRPQMSHRASSPTKGDGGSLGVYSHAASPLRKAASVSHLRPTSRLDLSGPSRKGSPLKRMSIPGETGRSSQDRFVGDRDPDRMQGRPSTFR